MRMNMKSVLTGIIACLMIVTTAVADEKSPVVRVVDRNALLRQSSVGKNISGQVKALEKAIDSEIKKEKKRIEDAEEDFQKQAASLPQKVLKKERNKLLERKKKFNIDLQKKSAELQRSFSQANNKVFDTLEPIIAEVLKEQGIDILLDRQSLVFVSNEYDITGVIMRRLNEKIQEVKVERVRLK